MFGAIAAGIGLGLTLSILIGPVFFKLINVSMDQGFRPAIYLALGIAASDTMYIVLANLGIDSIGKSDNFQFWVGVCGGVVLIIFGISSLLKKAVPPNKHIPETARDTTPQLLAKGFALNAINPSTVLFWISAVGGVSSQYTGLHRYLFFAATIVTVFCTDIGKAALSRSLSKLVTAKVLTLLNRVTGITLVIFGAFLMYKSFSN